MSWLMRPRQDPRTQARDDARAADQKDAPGLNTGGTASTARQTLDLLLTKYLKAAVSFEGIVRVERFPVPREALREAVLNALVHRDYMLPAPVQIRVHDHKLVLWNPATLPEGWSAQTLLAPHASQPHNPELANAFFRAGEIEAWGRGIERIFSACRLAGTPAPQLRLDAGGMWFEFPFDPAYLQVMQGAAAGADAGTGTKGTAQVTTEVTTQVTTQVALLQALTQPMARSELQATLRLKNSEHFRKAYLLPALAQGLVEMTLPEKPNSRLQQYRLTAAGRAYLQAPASPEPP